MRRVTSRSGAPATRRTVYSPGDSVASTRNRSPPGSPWERLGFDESGASWVWSRLHLLVDPLGARVEGGVSGARSASLVLEGFLALELEHERGSGPGLQCLGGSGRPSSRRQNIVARTILRQKVGAAETLWPRKERELSGGLGTSFGGLGPPTGAPGSAMLVSRAVGKATSRAQQSAKPGTPMAIPTTRLTRSGPWPKTW